MVIVPKPSQRRGNWRPLMGDGQLVRAFVQEMEGKIVRSLEDVRLP